MAQNFSNWRTNPANYPGIPVYSLPGEYGITSQIGQIPNAPSYASQPNTGGGGGLGSSYSSTPNFTYPTPMEAYNTISGLPYMQQQYGLLGQLGSMDAFRSAVLPEVGGVMKALGRSGLPSSSYADRTITDTMGSLYNKWLWNALTGYQNIGAQMPGMMQQWYSPYNTMLSYLGS